MMASGVDFQGMSRAQLCWQKLGDTTGKPKNTELELAIELPEILLIRESSAVTCVIKAITGSA
jgi:hypothetical protein